MMVIARRYQNIPIMPAACLSALLSGLVCWPLGDPLAITSHELLILALFGIVNSAVGLALFTLGARHLPAIETALIGSLDAPLASLGLARIQRNTRCKHDNGRADCLCCGVRAPDCRNTQTKNAI